MKIGLALEHPPSIHHALDGPLPLSLHSHERSFLKDFVHCSSGTSGARLAGWLQPESHVQVDKTEVTFGEEEDRLRCSWPTIITIVTKDQYDEIVHVPNMRVRKHFNTLRIKCSS